MLYYTPGVWYSFVCVVFILSCVSYSIGTGHAHAPLATFFFRSMELDWAVFHVMFEDFGACATVIMWKVWPRDHVSVPLAKWMP